MKIRRVDDRSLRPSLALFLEHEDLVLVLTATYHNNKPIYTATVESQKGIRFYRVRGGDVGHMNLIGVGITEKLAINDLIDQLSGDSVAEPGWFKKAIHVPRLRRSGNDY